MKKTANLFNHEDSVQNTFSEFNACIGNNGWTGISTYIAGYRSATLVMLRSILNQDLYKQHSSGDLDWYLDTAIYPICFSARHYIELYLKQKIDEINCFKIITNPEELIKNKLMRTHDVKKLWDFFVDTAKQTNDSRINEFIDKIEPYINDFAMIDLTGETFRYPFNNDYSEKHLSQKSILNLWDFYKKFTDLLEILECFTNTMDNLFFEYRVGTYTKNLSRANIQYISEQLPIHSRWQHDDFKVLKEKLKSQFSIGSKELSDAINIIKNHIEFKRNIYPNNYELPIDKDKLVKLIQGEFTEQDFHLFTSAEIACLMALTELGSEPMNLRYYSEDFDRLNKDFLKENEESTMTKANYKYSLRKVNKLKKGLKIVGYSDLLSEAQNDRK